VPPSLSGFLWGTVLRLSPLGIFALFFILLWRVCLPAFLKFFYSAPESLLFFFFLILLFFLASCAEAISFQFFFSKPRPQTFQIVQHGSPGPFKKRPPVSPFHITNRPFCSFRCLLPKHPLFPGVACFPSPFFIDLPSTSFF